MDVPDLQWCSDKRTDVIVLSGLWVPARSMNTSPTQNSAIIGLPPANYASPSKGLHSKSAYSHVTVDVNTRKYDSWDHLIFFH